MSADDDDTEILGPDALSNTLSSESADTLAADTVISEFDKTELNRPGLVETVLSGPAPRQQRSTWPWLLLIVLALIVAAAGYFFMDRFRDAAAQSPEEAYSGALAQASAALASGRLEDLSAQLLAIQRRQSQENAAIRQLQEDADRYHYMLYLLEQGSAERLLQWRLRGPLNTSLFEQAAVINIDDVLGAAPGQQQLLAVAQSWRAGKLVEALDQARVLARGRGKSPAAAMLARYSSVIEATDELDGLRGSEGYPAGLLAFALDMDPLEDLFFWQRIAREGAAFESPATLSSLQGAVVRWRSYHERGGIDARLRQGLAGQEGYRQRALELGETFSLLGEAMSALNGESFNSAGEKLLFYKQVVAEIGYQRERLGVLIAHGTDLELESRLAMLPDVEAHGG
jgi:hypothetical protein